MPSIDAFLVFTVLGPLFLALGAVRCLRAGAWVTQGRIWLLVGAIFSAAAAWLGWNG